MFMLIKLAWRNSLRNKRRTLLSGLAIGIGLAALILTDAFILGMAESMIRTATDTFIGHGQIHGIGFRNTFEIEKTVQHWPSLETRLAQEPAVAHFAPRTTTFTMITSPRNVSSILLYGIDPEREMPLSKIDEAMTKGTYLAPGDQTRILVGSKLAETLEVDVGDRVVLTLAQAGTGNLAQGMFRIGGIFHFNMREMDGNLAFVHLNAAQALAGLGDKIHEVAIALTELQDPDDPVADLWQRYDGEGNEALGWRKLLPELNAALDMSQFSIFLVAVILFGVVALGIMNTLFMSLYDRMFEFGVLRAVGTRPLRMAGMILLEAGVLALVSILIGIFLGYILTTYFIFNGIDYVGIEVGGVAFSELLHPVPQAVQYIKYPFYLFVFTLIVALYPALYAARINPVRALQRTL